MCNLYLMYYTDSEKGSESAICSGGSNNPILVMLPEGNDVALPPNPLLEMKAMGENTNKVCLPSTPTLALPTLT